MTSIQRFFNLGSVGRKRLPDPGRRSSPGPKRDQPPLVVAVELGDRLLDVRDACTERIAHLLERTPEIRFGLGEVLELAAP